VGSRIHARLAGYCAVRSCFCSFEAWTIKGSFLTWRLSLPSASRGRLAAISSREMRQLSGILATGCWSARSMASSRSGRRVSPAALRRSNGSHRKDYESLSKQFPPSLGSDAITYSAHRLLDPFSRENRDKLLAWALWCRRKDGLLRLWSN